MHPGTHFHIEFNFYAPAILSFSYYQVIKKVITAKSGIGNLKNKATFYSKSAEFSLHS